MDYTETLKTLHEMESRFADGFSSHDRAFLDKVHYELYDREITNTGCSDCYRDAYLQIILKLRQEKAMPKKTEYKLKAGAVISFFGCSIAYTNANLTDDVAERYLSMNTDNAKMFAELPDDWKTRVVSHIERTKNPDATSKVLTLDDAHITISELRQENAKLMSELVGRDEELQTLSAEIAELEAKILASTTESSSDDMEDDEAESLRLELGAANEQMEKDKAQIEALASEIENLKKENKSLKIANGKLKSKTEQTATVE